MLTPRPRHGNGLLFAALASALTAAGAQPNDGGYNDYMSGQQVHVSMAMIALLAAVIAVFVFIAVSTIYLRHCTGYAVRYDGDRATVAPNFDAFISRSRRQRRQRGLDAEVVEAFPTMRYAEAKVLRVGKGGPLECAVCLSEFEDEERLRLLPKCSHAFHPDCIGEWLASHVTCPVCRCNLDPSKETGSDDEPSFPAAPPQANSASSEIAVCGVKARRRRAAGGCGHRRGYRGGGGRTEAGGGGAAADREPAASHAVAVGAPAGGDAAGTVALHGPLPRHPARRRPGPFHVAVAGARAQGDGRRGGA